jgi:hypothetical protein
MSPDALNPAEEEAVRNLLRHQPSYNRTSYAPSSLGPEIQNSHFHDMELCVLMHALDDPSQHELLKKAARKAVRQRVKKLGMKYDNEVSKYARLTSRLFDGLLQSIMELRRNHNHDPTVHLSPDYQPEWPQVCIVLSNFVLPSRFLQGTA